MLHDNTGSESHSKFAKSAMHRVPSLPVPPTGMEGHGDPADKAKFRVPTIPVPDLIDEIRQRYRVRRFFMKQRIALENRLAALIRIALGWTLELPERERKRIEKKAAKLIKDGGGELFTRVVAVTKLATKPITKDENALIRELEKLAVQLPVWNSFGTKVRGFGALSLANIVGEAGNLSNYPDKSKLWKRMGVGLVDGKRQGAPGPNATKEDWIKHGYTPRRRSAMWNIGNSLVKGNQDGDYRMAYLARKRVKLECGYTRKHADLDAQRYMEKRFLRDLLRAWKAVT